MPGGSTCDTAKSYFEAMQSQFARVDCGAIDAYSDLIFEAWKEGRRVFVFGNGGSAYTASHHVTDYVKTASVAGQPRLQAFSLVDNTGLMTALGNDIDYDDIFRFPLEAYAKAGDIAVGISCSGTSANVVNAARWAKDNGLAFVAITGFEGGTIGPMADIHINIPCDNYGVIEDIQMAIGHVVTQSLFGRIESLGVSVGS